MDGKMGGKKVDISHSPHVLKTMEGRDMTVARAAVGIPVSFQYTENLFMKRMKSLPKVVLSLWSEWSTFSNV